MLTPSAFAARVAAGAADVGLSVDVLDEARMRDLGMRLLLGVAQGSAEPPRMVVLRHEPADAPASPVLALVGKGVTFDSGGISIKPAEGMDRMKDDMAGGAAVAAAMRALAQLRGALSGSSASFRPSRTCPAAGRRGPGDVVAGASGTTRRDHQHRCRGTAHPGRRPVVRAAAGRHASGRRRDADRRVRGGAGPSGVRAVRRAGSLGRHRARAAAMRAGDRVWPMPIYEEAREQLRSEIADLVNSGGRPGGAITAAAFLREFAGDRPWAHLDIAGTAWAEIEDGLSAQGRHGRGGADAHRTRDDGGRAAGPFSVRTDRRQVIGLRRMPPSARRTRSDARRRTPSASARSTSDAGDTERADDDVPDVVVRRLGVRRDDERLTIDATAAGSAVHVGSESIVASASARRPSPPS